MAQTDRLHNEDWAQLWHQQACAAPMLECIRHAVGAEVTNLV